jgi:hypothetical protein
MSWKDAVRKVLEDMGATVEEDQRGLRVSPKGSSGFSVLLLVRRLHMSLDRKVEVIGTVELPNLEPSPEALRKMLASSFEVEMKGMLRRAPAWRSWRELKKLEALLGSLNPDTELIDLLKSDVELEKSLREASPDLLEVFPEIMPPSYMESFLLAPGVPLTPLVRDLVKSYLEQPERLAWCFRAQLLYGYPRMPQKIAKNFLLALQLERALRECWPKPP